MIDMKKVSVTVQNNQIYALKKLIEDALFYSDKFCNLHIEIEKVKK